MIIEWTFPQIDFHQLNHKKGRCWADPYNHKIHCFTYDLPDNQKKGGGGGLFLTKILYVESAREGIHLTNLYFLLMWDKPDTLLCEVRDHYDKTTYFLSGYPL
jgi:hypothetical protein